MDALWHAYPHTLIEASGGAVGLPDGQMGNSEVGHLTIGCGRIIRQELVRIGQAVRDGSIATNPSLNALGDRLLASGGTLHLIGLCSDGGVHSHVDHIAGLLRWAAQRGLQDVCLHVITDGRDTPRPAPSPFCSALRLRSPKPASAASPPVCGRYWAMDRDNRWERTEKAYRLLTETRDRPADSRLNRWWKRPTPTASPTSSSSHPDQFRTGQGRRWCGLFQLPPRPRTPADPRPGVARIQQLPAPAD